MKLCKGKVGQLFFFLRHNSSPATKPCMLLAFQPFTGSSDTALATHTALFRGVPAASMIYLVVVADLLVFSVSCFIFQHPTWFWVVQLIFCRSSAAQTRLALISLGLLLFLWSPVSKRGCCDMTLEGRTTGVSKSGPWPTKLVFCNTNKAHHLAEVDCRTLCAKWAW